MKMLKCVSCNKEVDIECFGVFVSIHPTVEVDLGLKENMLMEKFESLTQFKICEKCRNKKSVFINYYKEQKQWLK